MKSDQKGIAIIGSGLAGLTAAHFIRQRNDLPITLFEACGRIGGRVLRSTAPSGEHGARYFLGSELNARPGCAYWRDYGLPDGRNIKKLFDDLGVRVAKMAGNWPSCCILNSLRPKRLDKLKGDFPTAHVIDELSPAQGKFTDWIAHNFHRNGRSLKITKMILAGETCAPWTHSSAQYALDCLKSAVDAKEKWLTIKGGSGTLLRKLSSSSASGIKRGSTCLKVRKKRHNTVEVTYSDQTGVKKSNFQGVIISSPDGHVLARHSSKPRHFHSYISMLFKFARKPGLIGQKVDLRDGLYTDHPFMNYLEAEDTRKGKHRWTLRILIPHAERFRRLSDEEITCKCMKVLMNTLQIKFEPFGLPSIKRWVKGLPCGGTPRKYEKVSEGIYLCGDRYGRWPSIAAAIVSGARAAEAILDDIGQ
jgi:protoporphyrinogen oxidase